MVTLKVGTGNEKWETRKWGNGTAMHKWQDSEVYMLCKVAKVIDWR